MVATPEDHSRASSSIFTGGQDLLVALFPKTIHPSPSPPVLPAPTPAQLLRSLCSVLLMLISCWPSRHFRELKQLARPLPGHKGTAGISWGRSAQAKGHQMQSQHHLQVVLHTEAAAVPLKSPYPGSSVSLSVKSR